MTPFATLGVESLQELLSVRARSDATWLILPERSGPHQRVGRVGFAELERRALARAGALRACGLEPRRTCILIFDNDEQFVIHFFAALFAGMIPVPWHHSGLIGKPDAYVERTRRVVEHSEAQAVLTSPRFARAVGLQALRVQVLTSAELEPKDTLDSGVRNWGRATLDDTAFIQYTSGSTQLPKAVELTHRNVLTNVLAIGQRIETRPSDVSLCWLPLYHDMGLVGSLLFTLCWGIPVVLMSPRTFAAGPQHWLWAIDRFQVTLCPAPNFAYQLAANVVTRESIQGLNLSSWRLAFNGAEAVRADTTNAFQARFGAYGFRSEAMFPVYGLAEHVLAACLPEPGAGASFDSVDREQLASAGIAAPSEVGASSARQVANVGRPLPGHAVRVVDECAPSRTLADRRVGKVQLKGPSVMKGYYRNAGVARDVVSAEGWLTTGDRGYMVNGDLFVLGRDANVIKRRGVRYDASDIEAKLAMVTGLRSGNIAVCGIDNAALGTDDIAVFAEVSESEAPAPAILTSAISELVRSATGTHADHIVLLSAGQLPKTTSGKIRHAACVALMQDATFDALRGSTDA